MKNCLSYYSHYCNAHQHWKFKMLRSKYSWSGEGRFWALNNLIAGADHCVLDLSKKAVRVSVADELDFSVDEFMQYLSFLHTECELVIFIDNKLTTETVRDDLKLVMQSRESARKRKLKNLQRSSGELSESSLELLKNSG